MLKKVACSTVRVLSALATQALADGQALSWRELPPIPANQSEWSDAIPVKAPYWQQIGLAGPLAGVHRDMLLVSGGEGDEQPHGNAKSKLSIYADVFLMSFDQDRQTRLTLACQER